MGDTQSCLRNSSSQSSLDMAKEVRSSLQRSQAHDLHREGSNKRAEDLIDLDEDDDDDFLNPDERVTGSLPAARQIFPKDVKATEPTVDHFDWSVPHSSPRRLADENVPKPKLLSQSARRERLEELKRLNQQLKSSPRNPPPPAKFQPVKRTVSYSQSSQPVEGNKGPSLLELEVQALASLGFVKLQPDIAAEPGPSQKLQPDIVLAPGPSQKQRVVIVVEPGKSKQKAINDMERSDPRHAGPSVTTPSEPPKNVPQWGEGLLELQKVALQSMNAAKMPQGSPQEVGEGSNLLELQKLALATMRAALYPAALPQVLPSQSQSQEPAASELIELQVKALSRGKGVLLPEPSRPSPPPSQEMAKVKHLHPPTTRSASKPPLPPPSQDLTAQRNVTEVQKMGQTYRRCTLHPNAASGKPPLPPTCEGMSRGNLPQLPKKCLLHPSTTPLKPSHPEELTEAARSVLPRASPAPENLPVPPSLRSDLLELQPAALPNTKGGSTISPWQSDLASPAAPSAASQPVAPERGDLLELEKAALQNMKVSPVFLPSRSVAAAANATPPESDLLELQKVALASMKASATPSQASIAGLQAAAKSSVETEKSDLLELQRMALANMVNAGKHDEQRDLKVKTSTTAKDEVQSSVVTPTSSCSSFYLEPATGPLETMLVELTSKDKALHAANRKVAEKEQLLQEYEGELSKALKMLESMSVRCTDAKEETARALSEAKQIYDELSQAWSVVESLDTRSEDGFPIFPEKVDKKRCKHAQERICAVDKKLEDEERRKCIEDFLEELQKTESARFEVQRDFEQQIQTNEKILGEFQHLQDPSYDHTLGAHAGACQRIHGPTHTHGGESSSGQGECSHVFREDAPTSETETNPQMCSLERTSKQLVLELQKIEFTRQENQNLFQEQMDRNEKVLVQLQEVQCCHQDNKQQELTSSEQPKQSKAEDTQLNARISELHKALYEKTKEANELHEQTLRLQRSVLEQEQRLIKVLNHQKTDSSCPLKAATVDFNGDTSELETDFFPSYSSTPEKTDFVGDTLDLESYVCSTCSLAEYICANCSSEPTGSDITIVTKFCPSFKADTADFECDTRELESLVYTIDFEGDTRELELESAICTMDFEGDTRELEKVLYTESREDKAVQVRRDDREKKRLAQERENWEEERKELIKRLDDFEASLLTKEENIGNLIEKLEKDESTWQEEKYQLVKRAEECETRLLAKEEEVIELSSQLEMAKSTLQGFTCIDSSTVVSNSSDISTVPQYNRKGTKPGSHGMQRIGRSDARELLDLRCEVLSLHECLVIKGEALKTVESELARSYAIINELRTKLARAQESERCLQSKQNSHRLILDDSQLTNGQSFGQKLKGKAAKKARLNREFEQATTRPNQNPAELLEKLGLQSEKLAALEKGRANMGRKIEELTAKCKYLEGIEKMYNESQDPLKAEAVLELEKELERNVEIIKKIQLRCSEFESRAIEAESKLNHVQLGDNSMVPGGYSAKEKKAWQAEREGLLAGLKYFREQTEKKDEELYQLRYELRAQKQKQIRTPPVCKSSPVVECPETHSGSVVEMVVQDTNSAQNTNLQLARVPAPIAAALEFERRDTNHNCHSDFRDHEGEETSTNQIRELTKHLTKQWKLQCVMEDRLDAMMAYVSDRVKIFEQQNRNMSPSANFAQFHEEARVMKSQLEQQLQVLRGTLSTSFHKLDEAKMQLHQVSAAEEVQSFAVVSDNTERLADDAAPDKKGKDLQLMSEKVALEDSAQTLQEKTSRLLHRLTSTRLEWNMNMLAASMAAG